MKSIDFKAAQCFISLNDSDMTILNSVDSPLNKVVGNYVYSISKDMILRTFRLAYKGKTKGSLCTSYDVPMYLNEVSSDMDTSFISSLLKKLTIYKKIEHCEDLLFSFFNLNNTWYLKYSCKCLNEIHCTDFPVCSKLSRIIDCKVNRKLLEINLPALFKEDTELMSSVQSILELKYSLDHMWKYGRTDSVREWTIFNWIIELTLRVRRVYNVDLTLNLEPKYFGYPDAESVRISNDLKSLVVNSKSQGSESSYIKFIDTLESVMEA